MVLGELRFPILPLGTNRLVEAQRFAASVEKCIGHDVGQSKQYLMWNIYNCVQTAACATWPDVAVDLSRPHLHLQFSTESSIVRYLRAFRLRWKFENERFFNMHDACKLLILQALLYLLVIW